MRLWSIVMSAVMVLGASLPVGAQSAPPSPDPRLRPPVSTAPAGAMPDRAAPPRSAPSAPMAVPPPPPGELLPPSERSVPTTDSGRSTGAPDPVRPGAR